MTEALPIKCLEAFLIGLYLTTGINSLERFNISFKTRFNSIIYRHVVLGLKHGQAYGAIGLSRRTDLSFKPLDGRFERLSSLVGDYIQAYKNYGHTVLRVKIGLPVVHDLKSFLTINWKAIVIHPNKTERYDYDKELDKVVRVWRQMYTYTTYRATVPSASIIQPTGNLITAASLPNRLQTINFRQNRAESSNCRRSVIDKTYIRTTKNESSSPTRDQSVPYVIRV